MAFPCKSLWQCVCIVTICAATVATAVADCNCRGSAVRVAQATPSNVPVTPIPDPTLGGQRYPSAPPPPAPGPRSSPPAMSPTPLGTPPSQPGAPVMPGPPGAGAGTPGYGSPNLMGPLNDPLSSPENSSPPRFGDDLPGPPASPPSSLSGSGQMPAPVVVNRFDVPVPPGTLGRTYQRRSTLAPDGKHPRWAAVDVHLPENVDVSSRGLKSSWTGEVWRLETDTPLLPGLPHIYAIRAERDMGNGEKSTDVRWVRLIMGRVVDLDF